MLIRIRRKHFHFGGGGGGHYYASMVITYIQCMYHTCTCSIHVHVYNTSSMYARDRDKTCMDNHTPLLLEVKGRACV